MEIKIITFLFGCILLGIGVVGGGFQVKELNIPKVGNISRFFSTILGLFFIIMGFGLEDMDRPLPPEPVPSPTPTIEPSPSPSPDLPSYSSEDTYIYWMTWKNFADQVSEPFGIYTAAYSVENSQGLSELYTAFANALSDVPVQRTDAELIELASDAIMLYRRRANLFQDQANILYRYIQFQQANSSSDKAIEAIIRGILSEDPLIVPREMVEQQRRFEEEWQNNLDLLSQVNDQVIELASKRDSLRLRLTSKYTLDFEKF